MQMLVAQTLRTGSTPPVGPEVKTQSQKRWQERAEPLMAGVANNLMNTINQLTGLARPLDFRYPSNVFIATLTAGTATALLFLTNPINAIFGAGWAFLTWSLGRELDPDQPLTATLASSGVALLLCFNPEVRGLALAGLCATGTLMMAARAALGSTGLALKPNDVLLLGFAPTVAQLLSGAPLSGLGVASLLAITVASTPSETWRGLGLVLSVINVIWFLFSSLAWPWWALGLLGLLALAGVRASLQPSVRSRADNGLTLETKRWWMAQVAVFISAAITALATPAALWIAPSLVGALGFIVSRVSRGPRAILQKS
jgi:hypothetical protein